MAESGIKCDESAIEEYGKMSKGGKQKAYRYIIFKIEKEGEGKAAHYKKVVVEKTGGRDKTFADMKADLVKDAPRYVVYDLAYNTAGEHQFREKIIFMCLNPSTAEGKAKMVYSTTKKEVLRKLSISDTSRLFQYDCHSEINEDEIIQEMAKGT